MSNRANVTSVEAIESFRISLILYLSKARPALEEVSSDVMRTRLWIENEQRMYWEGQLRRRAKILEQAQSDLFSSAISNLRDAGTTERMAVNKAKKAMEEAENKLRTVKKWNRDYSNKVEPLAKHLDRLHTVLSNDLPRAIAELSQIIGQLHAYTDAVPNLASEASPQLSGPAAPASEPVDPGPENGEKQP